MQAFLSDITLFFAESLVWLGEILDFIESSPALIVICIAMPILWATVSLIKRLISL